MEMMLDSVSFKFVRQDMIISPQMMDTVQVPLLSVKLETAAGDDLVIVDHILDYNTTSAVTHTLYLYSKRKLNMMHTLFYGVQDYLAGSIIFSNLDL